MRDDAILDKYVEALVASGARVRQVVIFLSSAILLVTSVLWAQVKLGWIDSDFLTARYIWLWTTHEEKFARELIGKQHAAQTLVQACSRVLAAHSPVAEKEYDECRLAKDVNCSSEGVIPPTEPRRVAEEQLRCATAYLVYYRELLAARARFIELKASVSDDEKKSLLVAAHDAYLKNWIDKRSIAVNALGIRLHVNDLPIAFGLALCILLVWLRNALGGHLHNMLCAFDRARDAGSPARYYELIAMRHVYGLAILGTGRSMFRTFSYGGYLLYLAPALLFLLVFANYFATAREVLEENPTMTVFNGALAIVFLVVICWLTARLVLMQRLLSKIWLQWHELATSVDARPLEPDEFWDGDQSDPGV